MYTIIEVFSSACVIDVSVILHSREKKVYALFEDSSNVFYCIYEGDGFRTHHISVHALILL